MAMASASKRVIIAMALLFGGCHQLMAQGDADSVSLRPSFGLDYTSELQTDFSRAKWNNLLQLRAAATVAAATSVLGFRTHIPQGLQNALVGVVTVTIRRSMLRLISKRLTKNGERIQILERLRRQLLTLGVLGDEVNLHALYLVNAHAEDQALLF